MRGPGFQPVEPLRLGRFERRLQLGLAVAFVGLAILLVGLGLWLERPFRPLPSELQRTSALAAQLGGESVSTTEVSR